MKTNPSKIITTVCPVAARLFISALFLSAAWTRAAESGVQAWVQRYSHPVDSSDTAQKVVTDSAGNVIVAGYSDNGITGADFLIIKYSGGGAPLWTNRYNGPGNGYDFAEAVAVDGSGNVFVTGYSVGSGSDSDYATIAYSGAGAPLWTNRYNGVSASAIAVDGSGNVVVTGQSYGSGSSGGYATIKYSGAGVPLWTNRYNAGYGDSGATAMAVDGSGNVVVTGQSYGSGGSGDYATIKYSGAGVPLWTNRYNGPANDSDRANAVAVDGSGNVIVTGESWGSGSEFDYATIKYSSAGVPLWTNRYDKPGNGNDFAGAVAVDGSGNVFVTGRSATVGYSGAGVPLWTNSDFSGAAVAVDGSGNVFVTGQSYGSGSFGDYATIKYSGAGVPLWTNRYNGPGNGNDYAHAVAVDGSGNVFVTGSSIGSGRSADYATIAYSGAGVPLWTNRYNGPGNGEDQANAVAVDGSGDVVVTGYSVGSGSSSDYATIKYSGAGVPLWTNRYNGPANDSDKANAVAVDGSGNVFVTGVSYGSGAANSDYVTIAYSGTGVPLWTNRYNGPGNSDDFAQAVAVDGSGNAFVTGLSYGSGSFSDYATIKYSGAGVPLWTNRYNGPGNGNDFAQAVAVDGSGNVFVTGSSIGSGSSSDYATIAYSGAGVPLWTNRYNGPGNGDDSASAVVVDGSGNVFVTGYSYDSSSYYGYATIKYSDAGVPLWTNRYNGPGSDRDYATAMAVDGSGNALVTGHSVGSGSFGDYATIKYSGAGVPLWTNRYDGPENSDDYALTVAADASGNVFVTGYSAANGNCPYNYDYATIKYSGAGVPLWTNRYNGPANGDDFPEGKQSLALGPDGSAYVTGASDYDFATIKYISVPLLAIERSTTAVLVSWPSAFSDFMLQQNTSGIATMNWSNVTDPIQNDGTNRTLIVSPPTGNRFYRLFKP